MFLIIIIQYFSFKLKNNEWKWNIKIWSNFLLLSNVLHF